MSEAPFSADQVRNWLIRESVLFVVITLAFAVALVTSTRLLAACLFPLALVALFRVLAAAHAWRSSRSRKPGTAR